MTTKKAVQIVDMFIENRTKHIGDLQRPENDWGYGIAAEIVKHDIERMTREIGWFKILRKEITPPASIPKKCKTYVEVRNIA